MAPASGDRPPGSGAAPGVPEWQDTVDLVQRAQGGDDVALDGVLARYYPRVLGLVRARLGDRLRRYVESVDVVQEAMGEAVVAFDRFDMRSEEALIRWLARLVENRIRDAAKFYGAEKRAAEREVPLHGGGVGVETEAPVFDPAASALSPLEDVERNELAERVRACVASLPARYREVVERRSAGEKWSEVAAAMGLGTPGAARMLHARASVALIKAVERGEDG